MNNNKSYIVTNRDRMAMIQLLNYAWNVSFRASRDRPGDSYTQKDGTEVVGIAPYTRWDVQAVNPVDNTYHTTDGDSITEAVNKWFMKHEVLIGKTTTLYEEKAIEAEIITEDAQFYG